MVECDGSRDDELTPEPGVTAEMYHFRWNASNFPTSEEPPGGKLFLETKEFNKLGGAQNDIVLLDKTGGEVERKGGLTAFAVYPTPFFTQMGTQLTYPVSKSRLY